MEMYSLHCLKQATQTNLKWDQNVLHVVNLVTPASSNYRCKHSVCFEIACVNVLWCPDYLNDSNYVFASQTSCDHTCESDPWPHLPFSLPHSRGQIDVHWNVSLRMVVHTELLPQVCTVMCKWNHWFNLCEVCCIAYHDRIVHTLWCYENVTAKNKSP